MHARLEPNGFVGRDPPPAPGFTCRRVIHRSSSFLLEDSALAADRALGHGHSDRDQIVLPYHGAFTWQVGRTRRIIDANVLLFVRRGQDFHETHPVPDVGHGSAIITPGDDVIAEIGEVADVTIRPLAASAQLTMHRLLFGAVSVALEREERVIALLGELTDSPKRVRAAAPRRVVECAKAFLHSHLGAPVSLDAIAHAVGVSPTYLTQAFTLSEGVPLYRYQLRLRLARALVALPDCDDLTGLALDLGFSSHSHFTAAFRRQFGVTPSHFRAEHRTVLAY